MSIEKNQQKIRYPYTDKNILPQHKRRLAGTTALYIGILGASIVWSALKPHNSNVILDTSSLTIASLALGLAAALIWLPVIVITFRKTPWIEWVAGEYVLAGLPCFILLGIIAAPEINTRLESNVPKSYETKITGKNCTLKCQSLTSGQSEYILNEEECASEESRKAFSENKKLSDKNCRNRASFNLKITVTHWNTPKYNHPDYTFTSLPTLYDSLPPKSTLTIPVNQGALGAEWVNITMIHKTP